MYYYFLQAVFDLNTRSAQWTLPHNIKTMGRVMKGRAEVRITLGNALSRQQQYVMSIEAVVC